MLIQFLWTRHRRRQEEETDGIHIRASNIIAIRIRPFANDVGPRQVTDGNNLVEKKMKVSGIFTFFFVKL